MPNALPKPALFGQTDNIVQHNVVDLDNGLLDGVGSIRRLTLHPANAPVAAGFDEPTMLRAMNALHGARRTPPGLRPALVTHLLDAGLVAYTDIGWPITAAGYRRLAAAEGTVRGAPCARSLVDQTARVAGERAAPRNSHSRTR